MIRIKSLSVLATAIAGACSSTPSNPDGGGQCTPLGTPGPADDHCSAPDGGTMMTTVDPAACHMVAAGDDGGAAGQTCPYGSTMYGQQGDDDDCKYHVSWSSTPICKGTVTLTVVATNLGTATPLTGAGVELEVFTTTPGDEDADTYCDTLSTHPTPTNLGKFIAFTENPPGTYTGSFALDQSGPWTVRFHFFESCFDVPTSPHAHAAFHLTVP